MIEYHLFLQNVSQTVVSRFKTSVGITDMHSKKSLVEEYRSINQNNKATDQPNK